MSLRSFWDDIHDKWYEFKWSIICGKTHEYENSWGPFWYKRREFGAEFGVNFKDDWGLFIGIHHA